MQQNSFYLESQFKLSGDQPQAVDFITKNFIANVKNQVLLGVTGSGKTFSMANVIKALSRPTLIIAPNKTLAAQLYGEMKAFFPRNAVEYFVSYYDYYQPEAYVPKTGTYIEKQATINDQIDRMRHSATRALFERQDVIIVASVSCIYGLGSVESYAGMVLNLEVGQNISRKDLAFKLTELLYKRNDIDFKRGTFRVKGDNLQIFPSHYENIAWNISMFGDEIEEINEIDSLTGQKIQSLEKVKIYANSHYITPGPTLKQAIKNIEKELNHRLTELKAEDKIVEADRLLKRVTFDMEMLDATGVCSGIENYSRYLSGREAGAPPPTLFEYMPQDSLLIVDESHVAVPQLGSMYIGDSVRKKVLYEHGFRLPSCADNRPLKFEEWDKIRPNTLFVSATPGKWEMEQAEDKVVEQLIRPTGLLDPICVVRPTDNQVDDLIAECQHVITVLQSRVLVTTLTKKMAEALAEYLYEAGIKAKYMHSDIDTLERISIIQDLRAGNFDVLIGINLLREGLDIPECAVVAILDADKEGFLRSKTSLIQTIGRCARHIEGKAILYGDKITSAMKAAMKETKYRRKKQQEYNTKNGIVPTGIQKDLRQILPVEIVEKQPEEIQNIMNKTAKERAKIMLQLEKEMLAAAEVLDFEKAAQLRDLLNKIR